MMIVLDPGEGGGVYIFYAQACHVSVEETD